MKSFYLLPQSSKNLHVALLYIWCDCVLCARMLWYLYFVNCARSDWMAESVSDVQCCQMSCCLAADVVDLMMQRHEKCLRLASEIVLLQTVVSPARLCCTEVCLTEQSTVNMKILSVKMYCVIPNVIENNTKIIYNAANNDCMHVVALHSVWRPVSRSLMPAS